MELHARRVGKIEILLEDVLVNKDVGPPAAPGSTLATASLGGKQATESDEACRSAQLEITLQILLAPAFRRD
jgi:hypothetical protein